MNLALSIDSLVGPASGLVIIWGLFSAMIVTIQGIRGSNYILAFSLYRNRKRTVGKQLHELGVSAYKTSVACWSASKEHVESGNKSSIQTELDWIATTAKKSRKKVNHPFEIYGVTSKLTPDFQLRKMANAYNTFSKKLRAHFLLSANLIVLEQEALATLMADYLGINSEFASEPPRNMDSLVFRIPRFDTDLEIFYPRLTFSPEFQIDNVAVIHRRERIVVKEMPSFEYANRDEVSVTPITVSGTELERLKAKVSGRAFDGVLPALRTKYLQRDPTSGHLRLLLELSEINYSAVIATNYAGVSNGVGRNREVLVKPAHETDRLLTLTLIPITSDGYLLLTRRSKHVGVSQGRIAPGVNGNLELHDRLGLSIDRDRFELPNLLGAMARESQEEIGLSVNPESIQIQGLVKFSSKEEVGTFVLTGVAYCTLTAQEIVNGSKFADLTEGMWELTRDFLKVPFPKDRASAIEILTWVINTGDVVVHLVHSLIEICVPFLANEDETKNNVETIKRLLDSLLADDEKPLPIGAKWIAPQ